ncbi:MAG: hypothetical protein R3C68_17600 [Myxococcota bacterium]
MSFIPSLWRCIPGECGRFRRNKLYLQIEADQSKLTLGNYQASLRYRSVRYERSLRRVSGSADHSFAEGQRTQVRAFAANREAGLRHREPICRAAAVRFILRDGDILEGSERIHFGSP